MELCCIYSTTPGLLLRMSLKFLSSKEPFVDEREKKNDPLKNLLFLNSLKSLLWHEINIISGSK